MKNEAIIDTIRMVFGTVNKPDYFTEYNHCKECADINSYFEKRINNPFIDGDPGDRIVFLTPEGFRYFLPLFIEHSLSSKGKDFLVDLVTIYLGDLIINSSDERISKLTEDEINATFSFIEYSISNYCDLFLSYGITENELKSILEWWGNRQGTKKDGE